LSQVVRFCRHQHVRHRLDAYRSRGERYINVRTFIIALEEVITDDEFEADERALRGLRLDWESWMGKADKRLAWGDTIIQDATSLQFSFLPFSPPYDNGTGTSLMGWKKSPSKRTLDLIEVIAPSCKRYKCLDGSWAPPHSGASLEKFFD